MDDYLDSAIRRVLAEDPRTAELAVRVHRRQGHVLVQGEVETPERRAVIERVLAEAFPDGGVRCDLGVTSARAPQEIEKLP
ncbi:hypothetical protein R8Z50_11905 [Longispora sp. K20-0274]